MWDLRLRRRMALLRCPAVSTARVRETGSGRLRGSFENIGDQLDLRVEFGELGRADRCLHGVHCASASWRVSERGVVRQSGPCLRRH